MKSLLGALALLTLAACGQPPEHPGLRIEAPWASPTPLGVDVSAGYMTIVNDASATDRLLSASSPRAASVGLHEMSMNGAVMEMRMSGPIAIPAHGHITLAPGGVHLMFTGVTTPFAEGETIPAQLTFEHAGVVSVGLPVSRTAPGHRY